LRPAEGFFSGWVASADGVGGRGASSGAVSADGVGGRDASFGVDVLVPAIPIFLGRDTALFLDAGGAPRVCAAFYAPTRSHTCGGVGARVVSRRPHSPPSCDQNENAFGVDKAALLNLLFDPTDAQPVTSRSAVYAGGEG
jgi:hypothetical protein